MSDTAFHFSDHSKAETLSDLVTILSTADESVTGRHVTPERNDYEQWIRHVHSNNALADQIRRCRTPKEVAEAVKKHIAPPPQNEMTPLKEKLRALAPKPALATPPVHNHQEPPLQRSPPPLPDHQDKPTQAPPQWTPSTPLPKRSVVTVKNNPHVHDFVLGLIIGIVIGVLAYGLLLRIV